MSKIVMVNNTLGIVKAKSQNPSSKGSMFALATVNDSGIIKYVGKDSKYKVGMTVFYKNKQFEMNVNGELVDVVKEDEIGAILED